MAKITLVLCLLGVVIITQKTAAQGNTFTYQGRLTDSGQPANGLYDIQLTVVSALSGGSAIGSSTVFNDLAVSNGLFTVVVSPGVGVFDGNPRWLEIAVRPGASAGAYTNLVPRQEITSAPYAVRAGNVANGAITSASLADGAVTASKLAPGAVSQLGASDGSPTNALQVDPGGLVGIGTGTNPPTAGLHIASGANILTARALFTVTDGTGSFTNLDNAGYLNTIARSNLLVLIGSGDSTVLLIDVSVPSAPVILSELTDESGGFTNLSSPVGLAFGNNNVLAIASNGDDAATLVSITNLASPVKLAELKDGIGGWNELDNLAGVAISGNTMAILAFNDNAITLADISNPGNPQLRVVLKQGQFGYTNLQGPIDIDISGNLLAVTSSESNAVTLIDITDPSSPVKRAELKDGVNGFNSLSVPFMLTFSGNLLAISSAGDNAVTLVDVSVPSSPVQRAVISGLDALLGVPVGLAISGNQLAVSGFNGVALYDISTHTAPKLIALTRDNEGGFNNLNVVYSVAFAGTNLVAPSFQDDGLTIIGYTNTQVSLATAGWVGIGTTVPAAPLTVIGNVVVRDATSFSVSANQVQFGSSVASGDFATAFGEGNVASGANATAFGFETKATGDVSTAFGNTTTASGDNSTAFGFGTIAGGLNSTALGQNTIANGHRSLAGGLFSIADGPGSLAIGSSCAATGSLAFALGQNAVANHSGAFVWSGVIFTDFESTAPDQFLIRAPGGVGINTNAPGAALNVAGDARFSGPTALGGVTAFNVTTNVPTAGSSLSPASSCVVFNPASAVTLSPVNAITDVAGAVPAAPGTLLILRGTSDANTVTINDGANTALGANRVLGLNDSLTLFFNGEIWVEMSYANN